MFYNKRKTIGVFIGEISSYFQTKLAKSISREAEKLGFNTAFFISYNDYGNNIEYCEGEYNIANLPSYEELDGVIIVPDTIKIEGLADYIVHNINERCTCPKVSIRRKVDGFYNVLINDNNSMDGIINHFIDVHGYTKIAFMSGPKGFPDADKRLENYKRILQQHHIPVDERRIFYGDFWKNLASQAVDYFLNSELERPEVIVCANDYMALSVSEELLKRNLVVPIDIAVSGFDDVSEASEYIPQLTTVSMPVDAMGQTAIHMIKNILNGNTSDIKEIYLDTYDVIRDSCGCNHATIKEMMHQRTHLMSEFDFNILSTLQNTFMSISLEKIQTCDEINDLLGHYIYSNEDFKDFYLCLCDSAGKSYPQRRQSKLGYTKRMFCSFGLKDRIAINPTTYKTSELLPSSASHEEPQSVYFIPLHFMNANFGYTAISFYHNGCVKRNYQSWTTHISNTLENIRVKNEMNRLLNELNELYIRDPLTSLYNRRGFERLSNQMFTNAIQDDRNLMILGIDMDNLKTINDQYGHLQGDIAIQTLAKALQYAACNGEICARVGGDEFNVIGTDYDETMMNEFINRFNEYLEQYNEMSGKKYEVVASYGGCITSTKEEKGLEEYLNLSDKLMYEQKYKHKCLQKNEKRT